MQDKQSSSEGDRRQSLGFWSFFTLFIEKSTFEFIQRSVWISFLLGVFFASIYQYWILAKNGYIEIFSWNQVFSDAIQYSPYFILILLIFQSFYHCFLIAQLINDLYKHWQSRISIIISNPEYVSIREKAYVIKNQIDSLMEDIVKNENRLFLFRAYWQNIVMKIRIFFYLFKFIFILPYLNKFFLRFITTLIVFISFIFTIYISISNVYSLFQKSHPRNICYILNQKVEYINGAEVYMNDRWGLISNPDDTIFIVPIDKILKISRTDFKTECN